VTEVAVSEPRSVVSSAERLPTVRGSYASCCSISQTVRSRKTVSADCTLVSAGSPADLLRGLNYWQVTAPAMASTSAQKTAIAMMISLAASATTTYGRLLRHVGSCYPQHSSSKASYLSVVARTAIRPRI
jgi:hypothetical protein